MMTARVRPSRVLAVTGHRPDKFDDGYEERSPMKDWVKRELKKVIVKYKPDYCISGMALGVDQWFAEVCVEMNMPFRAYVPFEGQESIWPADSRMHYIELLSKAHKVVMCSSPGYEVWKMHRRNHLMVDDSTALAAVFDGSLGGTAECFKYAQSEKTKIFRINPADGAKFVAREEAKASALTGYYQYLGNLKWKSLGTVIAISTAPMSVSNTDPDAIIPF